MLAKYVLRVAQHFHFPEGLRSRHRTGSYQSILVTTSKLISCSRETPVCVCFDRTVRLLSPMSPRKQNFPQLSPTESTSERGARTSRLTAISILSSVLPPELQSS